MASTKNPIRYKKRTRTTSATPKPKTPLEPTSPDDPIIVTDNTNVDESPVHKKRKGELKDGDDGVCEKDEEVSVRSPGKKKKPALKGIVIGETVQNKKGEEETDAVETVSRKGKEKVMAHGVKSKGIGSKGIGLQKRYDSTDISTRVKELELEDDEINKLDCVMKRGIKEGRFYPETWFTDNKGFDWFLDLLKFQKWDALVTVHDPIYPIEVMLFYACGSVLGPTSVKTTVHGVPITLSPKVLACELGVPAEGFSDFSFDRTFPESVSKEDVLRYKQLFNVNATSESSIDKIVGMSVQTRFVFNFILKTINPRDDGTSKGSINDILLVGMFFEKKPINLPRLIIHRIQSCLNKLSNPKKPAASGKFPYAMILSRFINKRVETIPKTSFMILPTDRMSGYILNQMKLETVDGVLVETGAGFVKPEVGSSSTSAPVVGSGVSAEVVAEMLTQLKDIGSKLDAVVTRLDGVEQNVGRVVTLVEQIISANVGVKQVSDFPFLSYVRQRRSS